MGEERKKSSEELEYKVSKDYKVFYTFIFKKFPIILLFILVALLFYFFVIKPSEGKKYLVEDRTVAEGPIKKNYDTLYGQNIKLSDDIKLFIKDGYLQQENTTLSSVGNLLRVKGWMMPYVVNINIDTLPEMKYFSDSGYDIKVFESLIDDVIIRSYTTSDVYTFHRHTLPVKNLNEYFSLSCLQGVKINNYLCDKYVNKFLDVLYLYDLNSVSDQLPEIYRYLDENQQQRFCEGIGKYVLFTHTDSVKMSEIIRTCGKAYLSTYVRYKDFYSMKEDIAKGIISEKNIYNNQLDIYMILSLQQSIAGDIARGHINTNTIYGYLSVINNVMLVNRKSGFAKIYYDWVFWFNEYILKQGLEKVRYSQPNIQSDIEKIIPEILKINNGKLSLGLQGLRDFVLNPAILTIDKYGKSSGGNINLDPLDRVSDLVNDLSFFVLIDDYYKDINSKDIVIVKGYFIVQNEGKTYNLNTLLELDSSDFRVLSVNIDEYPVFNTTLNTLISRTFFSLPDLYQYVNKNIKFYFTDQKIDFCTVLKGVFEKPSTSNTLSPDKKSLYSVYCTEKKVYISGSGTNYSISIDGLSVKEIVVSDPVLEGLVNEKFVGDTTSELDLVSLIEDIVYYKIPEQKEEVFTGSTKVIVVLDKIREYMNIKATDVIEKGDIILAEIVVQNIPFIIHYEFETDTIKTVFFKGLKTSKGSENFLKITNFGLQLNKDNQKEINFFLIEPLQYIKKKNPYIYLQYLRATQENSSSS